MVGQFCLSNLTRINAMSNVNKTRIFGGWGVTSDFNFCFLGSTKLKKTLT